LAPHNFSNEDLVRVFGRGFVGNTKAIADWRGETRYNNYALFGQTTWTFLPRTTLLTGLRSEWLDYPVGQCYSGQTIPATCTANPAFQNLAGATLPNAPKNKVTLALDYKHRVPGLPPG
jgi:hypothetical protein